MVGQTYQIGGQIVTVTEITDSEVIVDSNHPMAGKTLIFEITLRSVEDSAPTNSTPAKAVE
jgi:FKBP-type peptidyl-prolyl cis-trans isomerase 2